MTDYSKMKQEDFDRILEQVVSEEIAGNLLTIPGVYEVLSEHFNNEVLDRWEREQTGECCVDED